MTGVIAGTAPYHNLISGRPGGRLQSGVKPSRVKPSQVQPDSIKVVPDYMTSSFSQSGEKLPQELFPPPENREGFWKGYGSRQLSEAVGLSVFPAGTLTWKRRSAWSLFPSPLLLPSLQPSPLGLRTKEVLAFAGRRPKLTIFRTRL